MSPAQRRFLVLDQTIATGLITAAINAGIAWAMFRTQSVVPLWEIEGIAADIVATAFLLPLLVSLISTRIARAKIAAGTLEHVRWSRGDLGLLGRLPVKARVRSLVLGLVSTSVLAPILIGALIATGAKSMSLPEFILFKTAYSGVLAVLIGPLAGIWALLRTE